MKILTKLVSFAGLALTIVPPVMFYFGNMELDTAKIYMGVGMLMWFVSAPFWVNSKA